MFLMLHVCKFDMTIICEFAAVRFPAFASLCRIVSHSVVPEKSIKLGA